MTAPANQTAQKCFCSFNLISDQPKQADSRSETYDQMPCHIAIEFLRSLDKSYRSRWITNPHFVSQWKICNQGECYKSVLGNYTTLKAAATMKMFMECGKSCMPTKID